MIQLEAVIPTRSEGARAGSAIPEPVSQDAGANPFDAQLAEFLAALVVEAETSESESGDAGKAEAEATEETSLQLALAAGAAPQARPDAATERVSQRTDSAAIETEAEAEAAAPLPLAAPVRPAGPSSLVASQAPVQRDLQQGVQTSTQPAATPQPGREVAAATDPAAVAHPASNPHPASNAHPASDAHPASGSPPAFQPGVEAQAAANPAALPRDRRVDVTDRAILNRPAEAAAPTPREGTELTPRPELYARNFERSFRDAGNEPGSGAPGSAVIRQSSGPLIGPLIGPNSEATRVDAVARDSGIPTPVPARAIPEHVAMMATSGGGTARLRLHPANLGEVEITVVLRGGAVDVVMRAEEPGTEIALLAQRDTLGESLGSRELRMENFDVLSRNGSSNDPNHRQPAHFGQAGREGRSDTQGQPLAQQRQTISAPGANPTPTAPAQNAPNRGIDLRI